MKAGTHAAGLVPATVLRPALASYVSSDSADHELYSMGIRRPGRLTFC